MPPTFRRAASNAWPALAFVAASLAFALARTPYDDEWFSIDLAREATEPIFWAALSNDMHPPWVALLDRGLHAAGLPLWVMHALRVVCATGALALLVPFVARRARLPGALLWLAGLHPVVWMYSGAARWYPLLLLAHALRLRAVLDDRMSQRARVGLFALGAALGAMAVYIDLIFLLHDLAFSLALVLAHGRQRRIPLRQALAPWIAGAAASGLLVALVRVLSPLGPEHGLAHAALEPAFSMLLRFNALGLFGESFLPWPLAPLAIVIPAVMLAGLVNALRVPALRVFAFHAISSAVVWLIATQLGAGHPRYALCLWIELSLLGACLAGARASLRALAASAAAYCLAIGLWMAAGRGFLKGDLNGLSQEACSALMAGAPPAQIVIAPYRRLAALVEEHCPPPSGVLRGSIIRSFADARPITAPLVEAFDAQRRRLGREPIEVWLLTLSTPSSLALPDEEMRGVLSRTCSARGRAGFAKYEHVGLRAFLQLNEARTRYVRERYVCPGATSPRAASASGPAR